MATIQRKIGSVLDHAESSLNDLVESALRQKRYDDITRLVEALAHLEKVRQALDLPQSKRNPVDQGLQASNPELRGTNEKKSSLPLTKLQTDASRSQRQKTEKHAAMYPMFLKDENRLIKVGWSKKRKAEYTHRVPTEAILALAEHLERNIVAQSLFEIENLFPILTDSGEEIPGYQVYVIMAWLRTTGIIEKRGRDGYIIQNNTGLRGKFNELWNTLQQYTG